MKILPRLNQLDPSATLSLNRLSLQLEKEGKAVYKFGFGQSPFPIPNQVQNALKNNAHQKEYLPVEGLITLRDKIAKHTNKLLSNNYYTADHVFIGPGSKELIYLAQLAIDAPLLLPNPSWVSYEPQAKIIGKDIHWIPTQANKWKLDAQELSSYLDQKKMSNGVLLLNYPNNPTGLSFSESELIAISDTCRKYNLIVISDEIYGLLNFKGEYSSIARYYPEGTIISTGLSKWAGAGGWRLGTMIIPNNLKKLYKPLKTLASEAFSAVSAPIQFAACSAYDGDSFLEDYKTASRYILQTTANYCYHKLIKGGVKVLPSEGGFYLFPNFTGLVKTTNSILFCEKLLQETGVALLPGSSFGRPAEEITARLCFIDFDGEIALNHFKKYNRINAVDFNFLFPKIVKGMDLLMQWVVKNRV